MRFDARLAILASAIGLTGCGTTPPTPAAPPSDQARPEDLSRELRERMAELALDCVDREYPNKIGHVLHSDDDVGPPRSLTPAFFGCFDWHSSVHGHWLLTRLARLYPDAEFAARARDVLRRHLTQPNIAVEVGYMTAEGRASWERPYGLAWLLQLSAELHEWAETDEDAARWARTIEPLEAAVANKLATWLPKLDYAIRTGEHSQTAFAFGLMLDWADSRGEPEFAELVRERSRLLYGTDTGWPLRFEPGGQDFLSPGLASADLMRRVLGPREFSEWLHQALPDIPTGNDTTFLPVAKVSDRKDGKLAHLDGLNLSRAWMLDGILSGLTADDARRPALSTAAAAHRQAGLGSLETSEYAGSHWLGSFATYLVTGRGL